MTLFRWTRRADHRRSRGAAALPRALRSRLARRAIARRLVRERLAAAKSVARLAASLERDFPGVLVHALCGLDPHVVDTALADLVDAGLLRQAGSPRCASYAFAHPRVRAVFRGEARRSPSIA